MFMRSAKELAFILSIAALGWGKQYMSAPRGLFSNGVTPSGIY